MEHLCDCHTHTWYSTDAKCSVGELCGAAFEQGLYAVAITDHFDYLPDGGTDRDYLLRAEERVRELEETRQHWAGRLEVLRGIELGQPHWNVEHSRAMAGSGDFDLVIGSLHDLRPGKSIYRDYDYRSEEVRDAVFRQFFDEARELIYTCDFDTFGHYDYPLRKMEGCGVEPSMARWKDLMLPFLKDLAQSGRALEVNTCGLRRWMRIPGGEQWVLEAFRQFGGRYITVGSDGHYARHIGAGVRETYKVLRQGGFDRVTIYRQRKPVQLSI